MPNLSHGVLAALTILMSWSNVGSAEFWKPFGKPSDGPLEPYARRERHDESRWFLLPPLRWSDRSGADGPSMWQQWQSSAHRTLMQTRDWVAAPFEAAAEKSAQVSIWPWWGGPEEPQSTAPPGWFAEGPAPPPRPATVNDFLSLPRPE